MRLSKKKTLQQGCWAISKMIKMPSVWTHMKYQKRWWSLHNLWRQALTRRIHNLKSFHIRTLDYFWVKITRLLKWSNAISFQQKWIISVPNFRILEIAKWQSDSSLLKREHMFQMRTPSTFFYKLLGNFLNTSWTLVSPLYPLIELDWF